MDTVGDEISFVLGNDYRGINTNFILWDHKSDYIYKFEATVTMGETIEVEPVREDGIFVESEVVIPAGRVTIKTTSSVLFENSMWPVYKVEDAAGNNIGRGDLDCRSTFGYCFNASTDMSISFADLLDAGYTYRVTVTPNVDENIIAGKGTLLLLRKDGNSQSFFLIGHQWSHMN